MTLNILCSSHIDAFIPYIAGFYRKYFFLAVCLQNLCNLPTHPCHPGASIYLVLPDQSLEYDLFICTCINLSNSVSHATSNFPCFEMLLSQYFILILIKLVCCLNSLMTHNPKLSWKGIIWWQWLHPHKMKVSADLFFT